MSLASAVDEAQVLNGVGGEEPEKTSEDSKTAQKKSAKHDSGAADLEKVTDYAEETEISSKDIAGVSVRTFKIDEMLICALVGNDINW